MSDLKDQIEDYRSGKLTPAQMHALEKKALSDSFLADALEGASTVDPDEFADDLGELRSRMSGKKSTLISWRIAAGVIIVAAGLAMVFIPLGPSEESTAQADTKNQSEAGPVSGDTLKDAAKPEGLLSLEKEKTQPQPDVTAERPQQRVTQPTTTGARSGATPVTTDEPAAAEIELSEDFQAEELVVADQKPTATAPSFTLDKDTTTLTVTQLDDALAKKKTETGFADERKEQPVARARMADADKSGASNTRTITGQVTVADDGLPIPGVNVVVKGTTIGAVTDLNGNYSIAVPAGKSQLAFSFIGMETSEVRLKDGNVVDIQMQEDVSQLSEVVVTGRALPSGSDEPIIKLAEPIGGRKAYDKYLEDELRYPQEAIDNNIRGRVTVQFTVDTRGILGEFQVVKKLGYGCDEEVIRLVKEGPKWLPTTQDAVPIESIVRVRMKFDPKKRKK